MTTKYRITVILPCYNECENLTPLLEQLKEELEPLKIAWEVLIIDDGSTDETANLLDQLQLKMNNLRSISFSRNFGKEAAISAGLDFVNTDAAILMDADLQHPASLIPEMIQYWQKGVQVVYGVRCSRLTEPAWRRISAYLFYKLVGKISDGPDIPANAGDFRLLDAKVIQAIRELPERSRFMKGLFAWVGYKQKAIEFEVPEAVNIASKFSLRSLWHLGLTGVTSISSLPLKIWSYLGSIIALISLIYASFIVIQTLIYGRDAPGYASLMVAVLFLGGLQLISLGVLGEYLARVFEETKKRPLYLVDQFRGFHDQDVNNDND